MGVDINTFARRKDQMEVMIEVGHLNISNVLTACGSLNGYLSSTMGRVFLIYEDI